MRSIPARILVTGATGFVGNAVLACFLREPQYRLRGAIRRAGDRLAAGAEPVVIGNLGPETNWANAVEDVDIVVHAAGMAHLPSRPGVNLLPALRRANVDATVKLARQAAAAGVRRFIFISSIKVNGEQTRPGRAYTADDLPAPVDPYGISKHEAESGLRDLAAETGMEIVIIRPVLVYGPGAKANFLSMLRWLNRGIPLPFGSIDNRRSLVALDNLVDLISTCLFHPSAGGEVFLVSDGHDLSTTELLRRTAAALGLRPILLPVPVPILRALARVMGKDDLSHRLCDSLCVDITKTEKVLGWVPPVSVHDALRLTAEYFIIHQSGNRTAEKLFAK